MPDTSLRNLVRFGPFELDPATGDLQRNGRKVRLPEQQFQILQMLLLQEGGVVSREEIRKRLWPNDTVVEFDRSINAAIMKLRAALGDTADQPTYIETVARRGYRFMVPVQLPENKLPEIPPTQARNAPLIGQKVAHYRVLGVLGGGGMGLVYKAEDLKLNRPVALKFIPEELATDARTLQRFEREARTASMLNHPNICTIYQVEEHGTEPFIVMELLEGETLRELISKSSESPVDGQSKRLPLRQLLDIAIQIAEGLEAAHQKGIIHRDIKPANIFVSPKGRVKILDFGLAKVTSAATDDLANRKGEGAKYAVPVSRSQGIPIEHSLTRIGSGIGTVGYMSPEQIRGEKLDGRTDLFSFGLILFEMATGQRAFSGDTVPILQDAILNQTPPRAKELNVELPTRLDEVIGRALEKNRDQRYGAASEMLADLNAIKASTQTLPEPNGTVAPEAMRNRPRKVLGVLGGAVTAALLAFFVYIVVGAQKRIPFEHFTIQQAVIGEHIKITAISPDGAYLATVVGAPSGAESLRLHQTATSADRLLFQDPAFVYRDLNFSPDGGYIYFRIRALDAALYREDVYRVPVLGGQPTRILEDVDSPVSFIDRGRRVCFLRSSAVISADVGGGEEKILAKLKGQTPFSIACAPNGKFAVTEEFDGGNAIVDFRSGSKQTLRSAGGDIANSLRWDPNGKGLFAIATFRDVYLGQIAFLSYPDGNLHRITNDLNNYSGTSTTADAKTIATTQEDRNFKFEVFPFSGPSRMEGHGPRGLIFFTWLNNDRILASDDNYELRVVDLKKEEINSITAADGQKSSQPARCGPDALVVAARAVDLGKKGIYKMRLDGSEVTRITKGPNDKFPECSPDGKWLFYIDQRVLHETVLRRISLEDGSVKDFKAKTYLYSLSSDGKLVALVTFAEEGRLQIYSTDTGQKLQSFAFPTLLTHSLISFSPDNQGVLYATISGADSTIWRQPLRSVAPVEVAKIPGKSVFFMRPSPDGTKLGLITTAPQAQAVLVRNLR